MGGHPRIKKEWGVIVRLSNFHDEESRKNFEKNFYFF